MGADAGYLSDQRRFRIWKRILETLIRTGGKRDEPPVPKPVQNRLWRFEPYRGGLLPQNKAAMGCNALQRPEFLPVKT